MPSISVVTPSVRLDGSYKVWQTLRAQTNKDWEWLLSVPPRILPSARRMFDDPRVRVLEQEHDEADAHDIYKSNDLLAHEAQGELVVQTVDWIRLNPQALDILWHDYCEDPRSFYSIAYYDFTEHDENLEFLPESFHCTNACCPLYTPPHRIDIPLVEFAAASCARSAYEEVGGMDRNFDRYIGNGEKEFAARLKAAGYSIMTDHRVELHGYYHKAGSDWAHPERSSTAAWEASVLYFNRCLKDIDEGNRRRLDNPLWNHKSCS